MNRDIEDLCKAGIPIRTVQGTGGGISIMDGYRMDRTILTSKDMQMILAGLRSLDSVSGRLNPIIWCFDGRAGTFGAGVQIAGITDCLS